MTGLVGGTNWALVRTDVAVVRRP